MADIKKYSVTVIGGGVAGMSAAAALAEKGFHVTLCEERPNLGGRVSSIFNNVRQEWVDNGPHVLLSCYNNFCIFLDRIGARKKIKFQKHLAITFLERGAKKRRFYGMPLPSPLDFISGIFFYSPLDIKDKIKALNVITKITKMRSDPIKGMTVMSWLDTLGQSEKAKKYLWYPLAVGVLNENPENASALLFRNVLIAISKPSSLRMLIGVRVGYATVPFARLFEPEFTGFMNMHRGKIRLNCRINALETNDGKITGAITVKGERIVSDYYVVCVPPDNFLKLLTPSPQPLAPSLLFSPIVSSHLVFGGQAPDIDSACLLDGHFQWLFNYSRLWRTGPKLSVAAGFSLRRLILKDESASPPEPAATLLSLVKSAASDLVDKDNKEILDLALNDIKNFLPEMSKAKLLHHVVIREKHATITAGARGWGPGASNSLTTWAGGGINNLFIAGDWVEQELPSTIESAAKSGHAAANAVRESNEHI